MIQQNELRIGNFIYWDPHFSKSNIDVRLHAEVAALLPDKVGYIRAHVEHRVEPFEDDIITTEIQYASYEDLEPVPLSNEWIKRFNKKVSYPKWIQYVHELQNWYYWENEKKELEMD
jgi:hypothetical protein